MKLHMLMAEDLIIPELKARDREGVIMEMAAFLKDKERVATDRELFEKLIQREKLGSTAIGEGIAIPHCKIKEVRSPVVLLAVSRKGVQFESLDGKLTHVFFLVVSSPENPSLNLQILAAIAHLVRKAGSLPKKIMGAKNSRKTIEIIREEEEKLGE